jgi:hypothetical protein
MKYLGMFVTTVWILAACTYQPLPGQEDKEGGLTAQAGFIDVGAALDIAPANQVFAPSLVLDKNGKPVVAWQEDTNNTSIAYLKTWNGSSW